MQEPRTPKRDLSARWWRQFGFWGLTLNAVLGFPAMVALLLFDGATELGVLSGAYAAILAAWTAAAGIRQWGKKQEAEQTEARVPLDQQSPPEGFLGEDQRA